MSLVSPQKAVELLRSGEVVAIPTETVYGLAAAINNQHALEKIFATKQRPFFDPLIVHVERLDDAKTLARVWPPLYDLLAEAFWPGPLTLIAPKTEAVSSLITSGLETVALRSPQHPLAREILKNLKTPLAAPSANRFGKTSPTSAAHVATEFGDRVAIVDGGQCQVGVESTVISAELVNEKWIVHVLRPGGISRAQIETALQRSGLAFEVRKPEAKASSPGHLEYHYQPESPLVIISAEMSEAQVLSSIQKKWPHITRSNPLVLSAEPQQAARQLYSELRRLSEKDAAIVFKMRLEYQNPEWEAILDRLQRASTLVLQSASAQRRN